MKTQKIFLLAFLAILAISNNGFCQKEKKIKCKYDIDKVDEFSGEAVKETFLSYYMGAAVLGFRKTGSNYFIDFKVRWNGNKTEPVKKGDELMFKLNNGEVLKVLCSKNASPNNKIQATSYSASVCTDYAIEYSCTKEELQNLVNAPPTAIKLDLTGDAVQFTFNSREQKKISEVAYCITQ